MKTKSEVKCGSVNLTKRVSAFLLGAAVALFLTAANVTAADPLPVVVGQLPVDLGSAGIFTVLAGSTVSNTGPTIVDWDLGVWPGTAVTGFPPGLVKGAIHAGDTAAQQAQGSLTIAYNDAAGRTTGVISVAGDLGGQTLVPGLYKSTSTLMITGDLTLDASSDPNGVFIFQIASALTVATGGRVVLSGGAKAGNVFWQVGSSATLGTTSDFKGNILAYASITIGTGATMDGRALAQNAAVTLDNNTIKATFLDVPTSYWAYPYIDSVVNAGITAGCGGGNYCPENSVTRAQMAVFLLRAEHGSSYLPPACSGIFPDVECTPTPAFAVDWIEQLSLEGVTAGCGGGNYCPDEPVTRAQMAVFLLRAEHGSSFVPPACSGIFPDVECTPTPAFAVDWIEQLSIEGITGGCGAGNYCPDNPNTRAEMAVFIVKTFNLP